MTDAMQRLAACGLFCGACYHYRASLPGGEHLLAEAARRGRPAAGYTCRGCRSGAPYIHPGCAECPIRACADARGLLHCGLCPDLPCERLLAFQNDGRLHHRDVLATLTALRTIGPERVLADQAARWMCSCGSSYSWYEETCSRCGAKLASYGPDPTLPGLPKAILLDLDGTILDSIGDPGRLWQQVCEEAAAHVPGLAPADLHAEIEHFRAWYWSDAERHRRGRLALDQARTEIVGLALRRLGVLNAAGSPETIEDERLATRIAAAFSARRDAALQPLPGAIETLHHLRALGIRLALLTNGDGAAQWRKIDRFALAPLFDCILVEGEVGVGKPDERIYRRALEQLGVVPADTWMVGDNLEWDVLGPQRLGIRGIWLDTGTPQAPPTRPSAGLLPPERPDHTIHALSEVLALLPPAKTAFSV